MDTTGRQEPPATGDRRRPLARYVQFRDETTQAAFIRAAETAYRGLVKADAWGGAARIEVPAEDTVTERRGLLRRAQVPAPPKSLMVSAGLETAHRIAQEMPPSIQAVEGCQAARALAVSMAEVILDLVRDLAPAAVSDQRAHPAYRQTLRLAAELEGLDATTRSVGCQDPFGCVAPRPPEHWGRREEDVEVTEVRAVLRQLAENAARK